MASGSGKNQMIYKNMQQLFLNDIWSIYETLANSRQWFTSFYYNDFSLRFFHCRFFLCVQYHLFILLLLFSEVALNTKKKRQILLLTYFCVYMVKLPGGIRSPNFCDHIKMYFIALRKKSHFGWNRGPIKEARARDSSRLSLFFFLILISRRWFCDSIRFRNQTSIMQQRLLRNLWSIYEILDNSERRSTSFSLLFFIILTALLNTRNKPITFKRLDLTYIFIYIKLCNRHIKSVI